VWAVRIPLKVTRNQAIWNWRRREATCPLLATGTWHRFLLRRDTIIGGTVGQILYVKGDYVNVWCVPSATHVPRVHPSRNNLLGIRVLATLSSVIPSHFNIPLRYRTVRGKPKEPAVMAAVPIQDSNLIYPAVSHTVTCMVAIDVFLGAYRWNHTHSALTMHTTGLATRRCMAQTYVYEVKTPLYWIILYN
jgi:hypothetical protein